MSNWVRHLERPRVVVLFVKDLVAIVLRVHVVANAQQIDVAVSEP